MEETICCECLLLSESQRKISILKRGLTGNSNREFQSETGFYYEAKEPCVRCIGSN